MPAPNLFYTRPDGIRVRTGAGGVVARVTDRGRVLVALIRDRGDDEFVLPKGGVERGETLEEAAAREIAEEAGLTRLTLLGELGVGERLTSKRRAWQTTHYFVFRTDQVTGKPTDRRDWELGWFDLDRLPPLYWREQAELLADNAERIRALVLRRRR